MSGFNMIFGIILAGIGAALLALGMSVQRYAFTKDPPVPFLGYKLPPFWVWLAGLLIYFAANGVYAVSLLFAPLSLLAGIFTTLLLWNLYIGNRMLDEELTPQKFQGAFVVMLGVILSVSATSSEVPTEFTTDEIEGLFISVGGCVYIMLLLLVILICVVIIVVFETRYPLETEMPLNEEPTSKGNEKFTFATRATSESGAGANRVAGQMPPSQTYPETSVRKSSTLLRVPTSGSPHRTGTLQLTFHKPLLRSLTTSFDLKDTEPLARYISTFSSFYVKPKEVQKNENVPYWLDKCMAIIYPGSLGLDEGIAHLSMKAFMSLLSQCGATGTCGEAIIWLMVLLWLLTSLATLWWMRTVFKRYETTKALPIEYGAVMAINAMSGLIFYKESKYMEGWQVSMMSAGVLVIVIGLIVGLRENQRQQDPFQDESQKKDQPLVSSQSNQSVEVVIEDNSRPSGAGYLRTDSYDDGVITSWRSGTSNSRSHLSFDSMGAPRQRRSTHESFRDITVELGVDLPEMRGDEVE